MTPCNVPSTDITGHGGAVPGAYQPTFAGTSSATPHVSGLAALILSRNPSLTASQVREIIRKTADDLENEGWDESYGYGRINAFRALQYLGGTIPAGEEREWKKERKDPQKFDILLAGDVVIAEGATLRIHAGTVIRFEPKDYTYQEGGYSNLPEIIVKGKLEIEGTANDQVMFERHTSVVTPGPAWYGIRFIDQAAPRRIPNCEIRDAERALSFSGVGTPAEPCIVEDCIVEDCSSDGIFIEHLSAVNINNSKIRNNGGDGIRVLNFKEELDGVEVINYVNINNCSIWGNAANGITFINAYDGIPMNENFAGNISECDIHHNNIGINLQSGEVKIRACDIWGP